MTPYLLRLTFYSGLDERLWGCMDPLELVCLPALMALTSGRTDLAVGLIDGSVMLDHPDLAAGNVRTIPGIAGACRDAASASCRHGSFVAAILAARRGAGAPAIAPDCTLLVRPIFSETTPAEELMSATPGELAEAIVDCIDAGARVLNLSAAVAGGAIGAEGELRDALQYAARHEVLVVAATGNRGALAGSAITRHPWVIPVVAYARNGLPRAQTNLGRSIGSRGLGAPGEDVESLTPEGESALLAGTSVAAPFVAGAAALLWSVFPNATAVEIKHALLASAPGRRRTIVPPLLDAWGAFELLSNGRARRAMT